MDLIKLLALLFLLSCNTNPNEVANKNQQLRNENTKNLGLTFEPNGENTPMVLMNNSSASFEFSITKNFELNNLSLIFGNYSSNIQNLDYRINLKLHDGQIFLMNNDFDKKIRDNEWMKFAFKQIQLDPGQYTLTVQQITNHKLAIWSKNGKLWAKLNE